MSTLNAFPRKFHATETFSPKLAILVWNRIRNGRSWYATDFTVTSPTSITLHVYKMEDTCYGGIGDMSVSKEITDLTKAEQVLLDGYLLDIYSEAAAREFNRRREAAEKVEIQKLRLELFGV